jgi:hypothetical protein
MTTAAEDVAAAWPAEQAEEALRRIVTVILHTQGPTGFREMAVLSLACDALGIDEPIVAGDPARAQMAPEVPHLRSVRVG